jgi:plastocyanin
MNRVMAIAGFSVLCACERSGSAPSSSAGVDAATKPTAGEKSAVAAPGVGFDETLFANAPQGSIAGQILDAAQHPAAGVIVYMKEESKRHYAPPSQPAVIDQRDKAFVPRILAVLAGTKVSFKNSDAVLHNVYSRSHTKTFDLGAYAKDESRATLFDQPGRVDVFCAIHTNMHAIVLILDNPYFATTDGRGYFEIRGVPPGPHSVRIWSEQTDEQEVTAEVAGDRPSIVRRRLP